MAGIMSMLFNAPKLALAGTNMYNAYKRMKTPGASSATDTAQEKNTPATDMGNPEAAPRFGESEDWMNQDAEAKNKTLSTKEGRVDALTADTRSIEDVASQKYSETFNGEINRSPTNNERQGVMSPAAKEDALAGGLKADAAATKAATEAGHQAFMDRQEIAANQDVRDVNAARIGLDGKTNIERLQEAQKRKAEIRAGMGLKNSIQKTQGPWNGNRSTMTGDDTTTWSRQRVAAGQNPWSNGTSRVQASFMSPAAIQARNMTRLSPWERANLNQQQGVMAQQERFNKQQETQLGMANAQREGVIEAANINAQNNLAVQNAKNKGAMDQLNRTGEIAKETAAAQTAAEEKVRQDAAVNPYYTEKPAAFANIKNMTVESLNDDLDKLSKLYDTHGGWDNDALKDVVADWESRYGKEVWGGQDPRGVLRTLGRGHISALDMQRKQQNAGVNRPATPLAITRKTVK